MSSGGDEALVKDIKNKIKADLLQDRILQEVIAQDDEIDLVWLGKRLLSYWKPLLLVPFVATVLMAVYLLLQPNEYTSSATLYIQESSSSALSCIAMLSGLGLNLGKSGGGREYVQAILESRQMQDYLIDKFSIATNTKVIGIDKPKDDKPMPAELIREVFNKSFSVDASPKSSAVTVSFKSYDEAFSKELLDTAIDKLSHLTKTPKKNKRVFIEEQLEITKKELSDLENEMKAFQDEHMVFTAESYSSKIIDKFAELEKAFFQTSLELEMSKVLQESSASMDELAKLRAQILANKAKNEALEKEIAVSKEQIDNVPAILMYFLRLKRQLSVREKMFATLTEQYELAKISEAEELGVFELLDPPNLPERKSGPARAKTCVLTGMAVFVLLFSMFAGKEIYASSVTESETE